MFGGRAVIEACAFFSKERPLRIATRKSALALAQTTMAADAIGVPYELISMTTEGDRRLDKSLSSFGGKGVFIKELEVALLEGRADIAVHSLKDMPAEVLPQFKLAAVLKREDPRDAFLSRGGLAGVRFMDLPAGARIGTGSIRRIVQLKALRPDLEYVPIRGNIQTRIGKLAELDGVVLAAAGLKRMGLADQVTEYFSTDQVLPASGQGILAIETLSEKVAEPGRSDLAQILARANDVATYCIASAEMSYLKALNAGCQFPVASFAEFVCDEDGCHLDSETASTLKIRGIYWDEKSEKLLRAEAVGNLDLNTVDFVLQSKNLGIALAQKIQEQL